ncbi:peptidoglycan-binding protein [Streptomyces sp. GbtcB6]|uniref:peptidoglycan-binding protein n=1 Tax=Streptomyces sp. GbtcB6 TaxID=2824751 RepID=UPI001C2FC7BB|nr:peptidoglycan-binding protein [Streptomyces sp. GbtcB6]
MSRWKALPESLDPRIRRLVVELRRLKDHSGLSMAALASRTRFSKSSWERYLNGKVTPPRQAVETMADVCGGDRIGLAALWEVATSDTAPGPTAPAPQEPEQPAAPQAVPEEPRQSTAPGDRPVDGGPDDGRTPRRARPAATVAGVAVVAAGLAVLVAVAVAIAWPGSPSAEPEPRAATATTKVPTSTYSAKTFPCYFTLHDGLLYAGHSTTLTDEYHVGITVEAVAEVQCLVRRHGFDPKGIDGSFGPNTRAAVRGFQRSRGLTDDGIVGPMTWRELRKPGD